MSRSYLKPSFTSSNQIVKFKQKLFTAVLKSNFLCIRLVLLCQKSISLDRNIQFSTPPGYWTRDSDAMRAGELTSICVQTLDNVTSRWPIFLIVTCRNNETGDGASDMRRHRTVTLASALHIPLALHSSLAPLGFDQTRCGVPGSVVAPRSWHVSGNHLGF